MLTGGGPAAGSPPEHHPALRPQLGGQLIQRLASTPYRDDTEPGGGQPLSGRPADASPSPADHHCVLCLNIHGSTFAQRTVRGVRSPRPGVHLTPPRRHRLAVFSGPDGAPNLIGTRKS